MPTWTIKGYDGLTLIHEAKVTFGRDEIETLLRLLAARNLTPQEIIDSYDPERATDLLSVRWGNSGGTCGENPHWVASIVE